MVERRDEPQDPGPDWSPKQRAALDAIQQWLSNKDKRAFRLTILDEVWLAGFLSLREAGR
jgi:hypothetical protein